MTWYVALSGVAVATDASEAYGVSAAVRLGELCEAVSTGGELVIADSAVGVSVVAGLGELSEAVSTDDELVVADSVIGVSVAAELGELSSAISTGGELLVADSAVVGVGDGATDEAFGWFVTPRITKTSTAPVNSAKVAKESRFAREAGRACIGSGGGTRDRGGAPHEGQAVANELISLPHS